MGREDLKWRQLAHHQLISQHFSSHSKTKANDKNTNLRKHKSQEVIISGISDVAFASVYSEKTRQKKLMIILL